MGLTAAAALLGVLTLAVVARNARPLQHLSVFCAYNHSALPFLPHLCPALPLRHCPPAAAVSR
jgi:hypothetical protein